MAAATLIRIVPKTMFDFGYLPISTSDSIVVARAVNVIPYSVAYLWVRVYQLRLGSGTSINLIATNALPADDTQQSFLGTSTTLAITGTAPLLLTTALTAPIPPYLQIKVEGTMGGAAANIGAELSIDLLVRCCG